MKPIILGLASIMTMSAACTAERAGPAEEQTAKTQPTSEQKQAATQPAEDIPDWVSRGSYIDRDGGAIYAVGVKSGIKNPTLLRAAADNQARAEMMKFFQTFTTVVMKDYTGGAAGKESAGSSEEMTVETVVKTTSAGTLSGVEIVKHWINTKDGTMYALARLDLTAFSSQIDGNKDLSDRVKDRVRESVERAAAEMADESSE